MISICQVGFPNYSWGTSDRPVFTCSHESLWRCQPRQSPQSTRPVNFDTDSKRMKSSLVKLEKLDNLVKSVEWMKLGVVSEYNPPDRKGLGC